MAIISLKWFGGMAPRRGEQHLPAPHATEAENVNLYSGELRPLKKPALAHKFCRPSDECWNAPLTDDPSYPPELPDPGPVCVPVEVLESSSSAYAPIGGVAEFFVTVNTDASTPVLYQWFENNELMPGETGPTLSVLIGVENATSSFTAKVENPCGEAVTPPGIIDIFVPIECLPYDCNAMTVESSGIEGGGTWSLLDANWEPLIPDKFEPSGPNNGGADLVPLNGPGASWDRPVLLGRAPLGIEDADLCGDPAWCLHSLHNSGSGSQGGLRLNPTQRPLWGGVIPNINLAVVIRNADFNTFTREPKNFVFRADIKAKYWGQISTNNGGIEQRIQITRRVIDGDEMDVVEFNEFSSAYGWSEYFPPGLLTGTSPILLQVEMNCSDVYFVPTSNQGYYYASYDMTGRFNYRVSVTSPTGASYDTSKTVDGKILQCFDWTHGNANTRDIATEFKPWDDGSADTQNFLTGGWGGMYNLAFAYGTAPGENNKIGPGMAGGGINSDLRVAFLRNYADYEVPPECIFT